MKKMIASIFLFASLVSQAAQLVTKVEISEINRSQMNQISSTSYNKFLNYNMNAQDAKCALRVVNSKDAGQIITSIGFAYLVDSSKPTPQGWLAVDVSDDSGRSAKIISYLNAPTERQTAIESVCWE